MCSDTLLITYPQWSATPNIKPDETWPQKVEFDITGALSSAMRRCRSFALFCCWGLGGIPVDAELAHEV